MKPSAYCLADYYYWNYDFQYFILFFDFQYFNPHLMYAGPNWEINLISWPGISE